MRSLRARGLILLAVLVSSPALSAPSRSTEPVSPQTAATPASTAMADPDRGVVFHPEAVETEGAVEAGGHALAFRAIAGTLIVRPKGWDDAAAREEAAKGADLKDKAAEPKAEAAMFYTAYFRKGAPEAGRPITFLSTVGQARPACGCTWGRSDRAVW